MIIILEEQVADLELVEENVLIIETYDFDVPSGITNSILTEKGSMIVASAPGIPMETGAPSADGLVWMSDASQILGGRWAAMSSGGGDVDMANRSGSDQTAGTLVIFDADNDQAFKTTTIQRDRRIAGILSEDIPNGDIGKVAVAGKIVTVKVQGNVSRGMWLIASGTEGRAEADGYTRPYGAVALAITEYLGGGSGTVSALVSVDHYLGSSKGKSYSMGGSNGSAAVATAQILNFSSETVSIVAGAALSSARSSSAGAGSTDKGMSFAGTTTTSATGGSVTTDRTLYSTDVTANITGAALSSARCGGSAISASLAAYYIAGSTTAPANAVTAWKMPWATEITALQSSADHPSARLLMGRLKSTSAGYMGGGYAGAVSAAMYKLTIATEITSAIASGNLSAARDSSTGTCDTNAGYFAGGTTGSVSTITDKMPFSTETTAASGSASLSTARKKSGGADGLSGYILGGSTSGTVNAVTPASPVSTTDKLSYSTDTMALAAGAALVNSCAAMASFSANV